MILSVLSHFDSILGPTVLLKIPEVPDHIRIDHISILMDFYDEGFFLHSFGELDSANLIFKIPSDRARGNEEVLMISLVFINEEYDFTSFKEILEVFISGLKEIKEVHRGFYCRSNEDKEAPIILDEVKSYLEMFYNSLPKEKALLKLKFTKILIFGFPKSGVNQVIENLEDNVFNKITNEISIVKILLGNLSVISYDLSDNNYIRKISSIFFKDIDGIVFVSDYKKINEARNLLHELNNFPETYDLPLLILFVNSDGEVPNINQSLANLEIENLKSKTVNNYNVNIEKNEGITEAFYWLAVEITNNILRNPELALL